MLRGKLYLIPTGVADHPWSEGGSIKCLLLSYEGQLDFPCIIKIFFFWAVDQNNTAKSDEFNPNRNETPSNQNYHSFSLFHPFIFYFCTKNNFF